MGLDMYAYTIREELVGDQQTDVKTSEIALESVGFGIASDAEFSRMDDKQRQDYWARREAVQLKLMVDGIYNSEFAYWRKFNHLHGWMEKLYREKGGEAQSFNCVTVRLMPEDLDRLESMARMKALAPTEGFFFGGLEIFSDDDREAVLEFVTKSRNAINDGYAVFYDSWW